MSDDQQDDLLRAVPISRRKMLKRMLAGGAVAYTAPVVASFALDPASGQTIDGSNQTFGGNQTRDPRSLLRILFHWLFRLFGR